MSRAITAVTIDWINRRSHATDADRSQAKAKRLKAFLEFTDYVRGEENWVKVRAVAHHCQITVRTARRYSMDLAAAGYAKVKIGTYASNAMFIRSTK